METYHALRNFRLYSFDVRHVRQEISQQCEKKENDLLLCRGLIIAHVNFEAISSFYKTYKLRRIVAATETTTLNCSKCEHVWIWTVSYVAYLLSPLSEWQLPVPSWNRLDWPDRTRLLAQTSCYRDLLIVLEIVTYPQNRGNYIYERWCLFVT